MRVLVTGAGGFVGRHLCPRLVAAGHEVVRLVRDTATADAGAWAGPADFRDLDGGAPWPSGIDAVVHLAAANPARGEDGWGDLERLRAVNVEGSRALARRAAREGVRRLVFLSSANVHRASARAPVTEEDGLDPRSDYATSKAEAETAIREALSGTETRICILRPVPVFGPGGRGTVAALTRLADSPWPLPLRGLGGRRSLIHVEDLVEAITLALSAENASNEVLLISGGALSPDAIAAALRRGMGRPSRILGVPRPLSRLAGRSKALAGLMEDFVVDASRARSRLGWQPSASIEDRLFRHGAEIADRGRR